MQLDLSSDQMLEQSDPSFITSSTLKLNIGGIPLVIYINDDGCIAQIRDRYFNFIGSGLGPSVKIKVEFSPTLNSQGELSPNARIPLVTFDSSKKNGTICWHGLYGEFNLAAREGNARCTSIFGLNSFLRFIYSLILMRESGFLIHASSIIRKSEGYLFPGKSGAGKTTITRLSPDSAILTDEISLVKKVNGHFHIYGTPFSRELQVGGENVHTSIKSVYFPKKDQVVFKDNTGTLEALKMLLPNVVFYANNEQFSGELFNICLDFVRNVPCYRLHFLQEPSFWRIIDAE